MTVNITARTLVQILLDRQRPSGRESGPLVVSSRAVGHLEGALDRYPAGRLGVIFQGSHHLRVRCK